MSSEESEFPEIETVESEERRLDARTKKLVAGAVGIIVIIVLCAIFIPKLFSGGDEKPDEHPSKQQVEAVSTQPLDGLMFEPV